MTNPNKAKGTDWEVKVTNYFRDDAPPPIWAKRVVRDKVLDEGDINIGPDVIVLQAKNWGNLAGALLQGIHGAEVQASRAGTRWGWAVIKRRNKSVAEGYVAMSVRQARDLAAFILAHQDCSNS